MSSDAINQHIQTATSERAKKLGTLMVATFVLPWLYASAQGHSEIIFSWQVLQNGSGIGLVFILDILALGICMLILSKNADMPAEKKAQILGGLGAGAFILAALAPNMPFQILALIIGGPVMAFGARAWALDSSCNTGKLSMQIGAGLVCLGLLLPVHGKVPLMALVDAMGYHFILMIITLYIFTFFGAAVTALIMSFGSGAPNVKNLNYINKVGTWWLGGFFALLGILMVIYMDQMGGMLRMVGAHSPFPGGATIVPLMCFWAAIWFSTASEMATAGGLTFCGGSSSAAPAAAAPAAPEAPAAPAAPAVEEAAPAAPAEEAAPAPVVEEAAADDGGDDAGDDEEEEA